PWAVHLAAGRRPALRNLGQLRPFCSPMRRVRDLSSELRRREAPRREGEAMETSSRSHPETATAPPASSSPAPEGAVGENGLQRGLTARHIRFMALGSAIGTGLFMGSSGAIQTAGPAVLLAYIIGGVAVFMVMRALGEMVVRHPVSGSFGQ